MPSPIEADKERELEAVAMNIVHQIGDALYEAIPSNVALDHLVVARQATNDIAIDFAKKLIDRYANTQDTAIQRMILAARIDENQRIIDKVNENHADRYPKIVETDVLTYVSHGYAVSCRTFKRNAQFNIKNLKSQLAALDKHIKEDV